MSASKKNSIFKTDRRIKLGIWGLGRGLSFFKTSNALNFDVVAGCDFNPHMRERFQERDPGVYVTDDEEKFLAQDMDAVLVATFCPTHARDAIKALDAGKHVLSEVTSFHTMAEGVALCEAVERNNKVYQLAENYPFTKPNMYLYGKWREGFFGQMIYAEYEYVHECRSLQYTYIDGKPVQPGWSVHNWRSWQHFHYYNTHSLGPVMHITGERPTRVVSLPSTVGMAGYITDPENGMGGVASSLITFENGGVMRNLMGATTNDTHHQRIWGTLGAAEINGGLSLRLGGKGKAPKLDVQPEWPFNREFASQAGHGGGDFWTLYYFANEILNEEPGPFNIYSACDCTSPGILAYRSSMENGKAYDVPDFRDKAIREKYKDDHEGQTRFDTENGVFPAGADKKITGMFTESMKKLIGATTKVRAFMDWSSVYEEVCEKEKVVALGEDVLNEMEAIHSSYRDAKRIIEAYPDSVGARCLSELLEVGLQDQVKATGFRQSVEDQLEKMGRVKEAVVAV